MSSRNNSEINGFAVFTAFLALAAMIAFAVAAFISLVVTVVCLFAWNRPLKLGDATLEPEDARAVVYCGLLGMVLLPVFAAFCSALLEFRIDPEFWICIVLAGYTLGSLGMLAAQTEDDSPSPTERVVPAPNVPKEPARPLPPPPPYEFATWDDDEEQR